MAIGHADLHRLVKEMVKAEIAGKNQESDLHFCRSVASILLREFETTISTRAIFILLELIENECTKDFVIKQVKQNKPLVQE